jgi:predicted aldo/keto reductase-like oxidoreductase
MSTLEQMEENASIAGQGLPNSLTAEEMALIAQVKGLYQAKTRVGCTSCGYCLPCPSGVNIPANFTVLNNVFIYQAKAGCEFFYRNILKPRERASACEECGHCEGLCPQHIPIRDRLKEVAALFGA